MRIRDDGSIQSGMTPTPGNVGRREDHGMYRCMVTKVTYVDDPLNVTANSSNPRVLYDVVVLGGFASGQIISNCRLASTLGGNSSFFERTLRAAAKTVGEGRLSDSDGDIVFVKFVQGHTGYPVIVALDNGINTSESIGIDKSDGPRLKSGFNGIVEQIDKDGVWSLERRGGSANSEKGAFAPNDEAETTISLGKDQKFTITTKGGAIITVDGQSGKISIKKDSTELLVDGSGDKIALKSGFVELGSSVSDFVVLFTELLSAFNSHTHQFTDITPGGPVPSVTQPPVAPLPQSVGSTTVKVQS